MRPGALAVVLERMLALCARTRRLPLWSQGIGAAAVIVAAFLAQHGANMFANRYHFVLAMTAIAVNALLWDWRVAVVGVIIGGIGADFVFVEPTGTLLTGTLGDAVALANFIAVGLLEVALVSSLLEAVNASRRATAAAERSEAQKAALLVESNHRIKNNFQLVASLLSLEAQSADEEASDRLAASARRLQAMSRVHDQLTIASGEVVDARAFLTRLCEGLAASLADDSRVGVEIDVEALPVAPDRAITLGLLVNELFTNALKYAFPGGTSGVIRVSLKRMNGSVQLMVRDNGRGLSGSQPGTGRRLVELLVRQLGGEMLVEDAAGAAFQVTFPLAPAGGR